MSSYLCEKCDAQIIEKDGRYVTECEHCPMEKDMEKGRMEFDMKKKRIDSEPEYNSYKLAKARCNNPKHRSFELYGGRGIQFLFESYWHFRNSIGGRPTPQHSIDRYPDKNGNYEPGNVRWATRQEQNDNRRNNIYLTFQGDWWLILQWAKLRTQHIRRSRTLR